MAVPPIKASLLSYLDEYLNPGHVHFGYIEITTRSGVSFEVSAEIDTLFDVIKTEKYLKNFHLTRGINEGASLDFTLSDIKPDDWLSALIPILEGLITTSKVTWKTILRPGSLCKLYLNDEFKGSFLVRGVTVSGDPSAKEFHVQCYGLQEFIQRQNLFMHFGTELGAYSLAFAMKDVQLQSATATPQGAIKIILEKFLFETLQSGNFRFSNTDEIEDQLVIGDPPFGGMSLLSYYGLNQVLIQNFQPTADYNIWENIMKYQSPPFHEIWVTNGGKVVSMGGGMVSSLPSDVECLIFRPTPYDDVVLSGAPAVPLLNNIPVGGELPLILHTVDENLQLTGNYIRDYQVKSINLGFDDNNSYSMYAVKLSGAGMDSNSSSKLFPPFVDLDAMRYLGKKVFEAEIMGMDMTDTLGSADPKRFTALQIAKTLQKKAYDWFKFNSEFLKGTITTRWMEDVSEGQWLWWETEAYPDFHGYYYINSYSLDFDIEANKVDYTLNVTRGTPKEGFGQRVRPVPQPTTIPAG